MLINTFLFTKCLSLYIMPTVLDTFFLLTRYVVEKLIWSLLRLQDILHNPFVP